MEAAICLGALWIALAIGYGLGRIADALKHMRWDVNLPDEINVKHYRRDGDSQP